MLFRFLLYVLFFYILWRVISGLITAGSGRPPVSRTRPKPRPPGDFSNVEEADFEDVTPPRDKKNDSTTTSSS